MTNSESLTPPTIPVPVLEPHEADAIFAIIVRVIKCDLSNFDDKRKIAELQAGIESRSAGRPKLMAAIDAFGFEISDPNLWERVRKSLGEETFLRAYDVAFPEGLPGEPTRADTPLSDRSGSMSEGTATTDVKEFSHEPAPKIGDAILRYLRSLSGRGAQVAEIKQHLLDAYGIETHEKTPGMTLYRLSKDGVVNRVGRTWFANEINDVTEIANARPLEAIISVNEDKKDGFDISV
jgi:hypothetical protein